MRTTRHAAWICCLILSLLSRSLLSQELSDQDFGRYAAEPGVIGTDEQAPGKQEAIETLPSYAVEEEAFVEAPADGLLAMECTAGVCEEACRCSHWTGGIGLYILKPHWTTNPAFATANTSGGATIDSQTDFRYSYYATPLAWFGYVGESGLGVRTRFWLFDQSSSTSFINDGSVTIISAAPLNYLNSSSTAGDLLTFSSGLDLDVVDFEVTQTFDACGFAGQLFAGGRYARIEQTYLNLEEPLTGLADIVMSSHVFDGFGPSIGAEVRRAIGGGGLSLYANGRGSVLFGQSSQQATNVNNNVLTNSGAYSNWDVIPAFETELGILWERNTVRGRLFLDAGVVGMAFLGAGNAANTQLLINSTDDQADKNAALGLFGFKLAAGMDF